MNRIITVLIPFFLFTGIYLYAVEELPDVEITGPSELKSVLEKRGLSSMDLLIPDVVDSIRPLIPEIKEKKPAFSIQHKNYLYLGLSNRIDFNAYYIGKDVFNSPMTLKAVASRYTLSNDWDELNAELGLLYSPSASGISAFLKTINSQSLYNIDYQSVNVFNVNYNIKHMKLSDLFADIYVKAAIENCHYQYLHSDGEHNKLYLNNSLGINTKLTDDVSATANAVYAYKTPLLNVNLDFHSPDASANPFPVSGLSIYLTDRRVIPGLHFYKRLEIDKNNSVQLYQTSGFRIDDNYDLLTLNPWQKQLNDALVTFEPLNAHVAFNSNYITNRKLKLVWMLDLGLQYYVDYPVYGIGGDIHSLPCLSPENILRNNALFKSSISWGNSQFSQSCLLDQGWRTEHKNHEQDYVPLVSLESFYRYKWELFAISFWVNQYYRTLSDAGSYLRESVDPGAEFEYFVKPDFTIFLKGDNLLNKARYFYRNVPTEWETVTVGFSYSF